MPESYTEIVQFQWKLDGDSGPDAAAAKMNTALDGIDAKITAIGINAANVFGSSFQTSLAPAITSVGSLNASLTETLRLLTAIKGVGPIDPFAASGAPPPPPNNPVQPRSSDTVVGTEGQYTFYQSGRIRGPGGHWASPAEVVPQLSPAATAIVPSQSPFSGDMFPATQQTGFQALPSGYGPGRLSLNQSRFLAGGFSYDAPQEFDTSGWIQVPQKPYSKPVLENLGWMRENDPRYITQSFGGSSVFGLSQQENDTLNSAQAPESMPPWLRNLVAPSGYSKPLLTNFGASGAPSNFRLGDEWSNGVPQSNYQTPILTRLDLDSIFKIQQAMGGFSGSPAEDLRAYTKPSLFRQGTRDEWGQAFDPSPFVQIQNLLASDQSPFIEVQKMLDSAKTSEPQIVSLAQALRQFGAGYSALVLSTAAAANAPWQTSIGPVNQRFWNSLGPGATVGNSMLPAPVNTPWRVPDPSIGTFSAADAIPVPPPSYSGWQVPYGTRTTFGAPYYPSGYTPPGVTPPGTPPLLPPGPGFPPPPVPPTPPPGPGPTPGPGPSPYSGGPTGPFGENFVDQYLKSLIQKRAEQLFSTGNFAAGEDVMQTFGVPNYISARSSAANVNQVFSDASFARLPGPGGPTGGRFYDQFYYQQQGQNLGAQMAAAQAEVNVDPARIQAIGEAIKQNRKAQDEFNDSSNAFDNIITRIATRIIIYTAIYTAARSITGAVKELVDQMVILDSTQARLGFINGQSVGVTQGQFQQAGQYGITPTQAAPGLIAAAQRGATPEQIQQSNQIAMVAGPGQAKVALVGLTQIQEQANAVGLKHVDVMNFIAQSYKTADLPLKEYLDSYRQGIVMSGQFGTSAEALGLAIEQTSQKTGQSVEQVSTQYQSILSKIQEPASQTRLSALGIGFTPSQNVVDMVRQLATALHDLQQQGRVGDINTVLEALQGGGIGGYTRVRELPAAWVDIYKAINDIHPALASFGALQADVAGTAATRTNQLKASWDNYLQSLGNTGPLLAAKNAILGVMDAAASGFNNKAIITSSADQWNALSPDRQKQLMAQYQQETGVSISNKDTGGFFGGLVGSYKEPVANLTDQMLQQNGVASWNIIGRTDLERKYEAQFDQWFQEKLKGGGSATAFGVSGPGGSLLHSEAANESFLRYVPPANVADNQLVAAPPFGGIDKAPSGSFSDFEKSVRSFETQLTRQGITLAPETRYFYNQTTGVWNKMLADTNAIRLADEKIAANTTSFAGILPKGEDLAKIQARVNQIDSSGAVGAAGLDTTQVKQQFWDPTSNSFKALVGTTTAIQIATEEAAKLLQQQITGTFNVPTGGEAVVAFFALQQGFVPGGAGGTSGASALNGSATALSGSAYQLTSSAAALLAAANAIGGPNGDILRGIAAHESNTYTTGTGNAGIAGYIQAHQRALLGGSSGFGSFQTPQTSNYPGSLVSHQPLPQSNIDQQANSFERDRERLHQFMTNGRTVGQSNGLANANLSVNNAIRINIDGRQIAYYMNRKTYRQFESVRNSAVGAPNSVVSI